GGGVWAGEPPGGGTTDSRETLTATPPRYPSRMPYVYILASITRVLYVGSTEEVQQRVFDHRGGRGAAFTKKYRVTRLVYFEEAESLGAARRRELEIKAWRREKKTALIESLNPEWQDLLDSLATFSSEESCALGTRAPLDLPSFPS
ncbi:MAG: GIY-YIG nuclease family protein, partial [Thermoanaerobaculia bacterium]